MDEQTKIMELELELKFLREKIDFADRVILSIYDNKDQRSVQIGKIINYMKKYHEEK